MMGSILGSSLHYDHWVDCFFFCSFWQSGLTLNSEGVLGPLASDLPVEGLDFSDVPPAEDDAPPAEEDE